MSIKAKQIKAKNVVDGVQMQGGSADDAAKLAEAAAKLGAGGITADEINADNVVEGLQFIKDPANVSLNELRQEMAALQKALAEAGASDGAQAIAAQASTELKKEKPEPSKLVQTIEKLSSSFKNIADAAPNALKIARWVPAVVAAVKAWAGVP
jgi:hypothetical protein